MRVHFNIIVSSAALTNSLLISTNKTISNLIKERQRSLTVVTLLQSMLTTAVKGNVIVTGENNYKYF